MDFSADPGGMGYVAWALFAAALIIPAILVSVTLVDMGKKSKDKSTNSPNRSRSIPAQIGRGLLASIIALAIIWLILTIGN